MVRHTDRNSSSERARFRNVMDNPQNENIAKDIFDILKAAHPDKQGEDIIVAEENAINEGAGTGLLQGLNSKNALDFGFFGHENFSLEELGLLNLNKIPGLDVSDDMRAGIENAIVTAIKTEFSHGLERDTARKFNDTVKYHNTTLSELLITIDLFEKQLNGEEKSKYLKFKNNFVLTFYQIKNHLAPINDASNNNINENLDTKSFSEWTESQQKGFDYLFSKLILSRLHSRVDGINSLAENIANSFSLPLSLSVIPQSEEFGLGENGYESLRQYAKDNFPELYEELVNATAEQLEEIYWKIYLNKVNQSSPELADVLGILYENNFDTAILNTDEVKRNAFISKIAELRLNAMEKSGAIELFGNDSEQFKQFFMDLFDFSKNEISVNGVTLQVEKKLDGGETPELKNLSDFLNARELPITFTIKGVDGLNLSADDRILFNKLFQENIVDKTETNPDGTPGASHQEIVLERSKIGKLLVLYLMGKPSVVESYDPESEQGKKIDNFFRSLDREVAVDKSKRELNEEEKKEKREGENGDGEENEEGEADDEVQNENSERERIMSLWNNLKGDQAPEGEDSFREGAVFYYPFGTSVLPPKGENSKDWMKFYIKDVDWNRGMIKYRTNGFEYKLPGGYENKDGEMPISVFSKRFLEKEPEIGGAPFKLLSSKTNFEETFKDFSQQGICSSSIFGDAEFDNGKLMIRNRGLDGDEHYEKVEYFSSGMGVPDGEKVIYKVDWNGDGTVSVKAVPQEYKRKMSYPDFLIFLNEKGLTPKTERMAEAEKMKIKDIVSHTKTTWKWVSIGSIIYSFKNIWKTINDGMNNYQKKQDEDCLNWLVGKGVYDKIGKALGWMSPALAEAAMQAQDKAEKGMDKSIWEGIDSWLKEFSSLADFANFFEKGQDAPSGQKFRQLNKILKANGFNTLKDVVSSGTFVGENDNLRPIIAAAMIANIKKGAGLYRGLANQDNQCLWIRCLLGPDHYRRYLEMRQQLENDIKQAELSGDGGKVKQLSDLLVQSETTYIINCIENSHGKDQYFGAPSDNNAQALKLLYSNEFASQLGSAVDEGIGEAAMDKGYSGTKKYNLFDPVNKEVEKNITSGRIDRGLGNIERLGEVAVNDSDFVNLNVAMTFVTLTGILNRKEGKNVRTRFDGLARAYMLPSAFFGEKNENQRNAWYILDKCGCGFTEAMAAEGITMQQFMSSSDDVPYKKLYGALQKWWRANASQIDSFFESLKTTEQKDPILKKVSDILWEPNPDSISPKWRGKPKITGHYALLASPESIRQNKGYDRDGFSGDTDERNDKAAFWKSLLTSLKNAEKNNGSIKFFLNEFKLLFNYEGFGTGNDEENNRMIQMIREVRDRAGKPIVFQVPEGGRSIDIPSNFVYSSDDYKHLIWYMFKGRVLNSGSSAPPKQVDDVLSFFVRYFTEHFEEISGNNALLQDVFPVRENLPVKKLVPWSEYQDNIQGDNNYFDFTPDSDDADIDSKDAEKWKKAMKKLKKKHYRRSDEFYNDEFISLQKNLKRKGISARSLAELGGEQGVTIK